MDKYNEIFKLWDNNADRDKATGADLKYQIEEDLANYYIYDYELN